jgi:hypothetical protein
VEFNGSETPTKLRQMTLRALAEGLITPIKAEELCPGCTEDDGDKPTEDAPVLSPESVLSLPRAKRNEILRRAAALLQKEYAENKELTAFEDFEGGGLNHVV